jgi:predicted amino acid-binding ACT domain protein
MSQASHVSTLRVEGGDKPGLGAKLANAIGGAGVNLRGVSAAVLGGKFVAYLGFDSPDDASRAAKALKAIK